MGKEQREGHVSQAHHAGSFTGKLLYTPCGSNGGEIDTYLLSKAVVR